MTIVEKIDFSKAKCISGRALACDLLLEEIFGGHVDVDYVPSGNPKSSAFWGSLNGVPVMYIKDYRVSGTELEWIAFGSLLVNYGDTSEIITVDEHFRE